STTLAATGAAARTLRPNGDREHQHCCNYQTQFSHSILSWSRKSLSVMPTAREWIAANELLRLQPSAILRRASFVLSASIWPEGSSKTSCCKPACSSRRRFDVSKTRNQFLS